MLCYFDTAPLHHRDWHMTGRTATLISASAGTAMAACAWWFGLREPPPPQPSQPGPEARRLIEGAKSQAMGETQRWMNSKMIHQAWRDAPLAVGSQVPELIAQGWLNGPPPKLAGGIAVIDVWDDT